MDAALKDTSALTVRLSSEQLDIVRQVDSGEGNILVIARAGTGKTFLIMQSLTLMNGTIAIAAYNRKIAKEIKSKVAKTGNRAVDAGTFHSFGDRVIRKLYPAAKLEGYGDGKAGFYKFARIADELSIPKYLHSFVKKCVAMAMAQGFGVPGLASAKDVNEWRKLVAHYSIDNEIADDNVVTQIKGREALIIDGLRFAYAALNLSKKMAHEVYTYDEMLWLPLIVNAKFPQFNWVCVDEAQDSNPVRREMARRMLLPNGRMMFVGDDKQSINGFCGADNDALDVIRRDFACRVFPMTVTYRCSKAVVRLAQTIVPDFKAAETNREGSVKHITDVDMFQLPLVPGVDAVICRNTRPLVEVCYNLIKRGIPAHIEGKEIGKGLAMLIGRWPHIRNLSMMTDQLKEYRDLEISKLVAVGKDVAADALSDKVETVLAIISGLPKGSNVSDLVTKIESMFADTDEGRTPTVTLMTAHKSKGLEFETVYLYGANVFMPSKHAKLAWELEQEYHLMNVAYTRAIDTLVMVSVTK